MDRYGVRADALRLLRSVWQSEVGERALRRITNGRSYEGLRSRLPPLHCDYRPGAIRDVTRYGLRWRIDLSDLIGWYLFWGFTDPHHDKLISLCPPGGTAIDAGANIGVTALRMAVAVGSGGRVIAFEPDPVNFERLLGNLALNPTQSVHAIHAALGECSGVLHAHVVDPRNRGSIRLTATGAEARVDVRRLDDLNLPIERLDVLKVDTEGFEARVLKGARRIIEAHRPYLFVEVVDDRLRDQGSSACDLLAMIAELGYEARDALTGRPATPGFVASDIVCRPAGRSGEKPRRRSEA